MSSEEGVRGTNDDASQCKRHAVERGYWHDPYISMFGPRNRQIHAPEISIGYYARVQGLRLLVKRFLEVTSCASQIISLGAGFDTMYWILKDEGITPSSFIEVDFDAVTSRKIHYIRRSKTLLEKISSEDEEIKFSTSDLHSKDYHLIAADLRNLVDLKKKFEECKVDFNLPTMFIAECVLIYIENSKTNALLKWITDNFLSVFFVNYEQVNMKDRFGEVMMDNLRARECLLHTEYCDNLDTQTQRFTAHGFEQADAMEMRHVLASLPSQDVHRVERLEFLDERELLDQLMSHYCYCWAYKDPHKLGLADVNFSQ